MSFVPIIDPSSDILDRDKFEAPKETSRFTGILDEAKATLEQSPVGMAASTIAKYAQDQVNPGEFLTPEAIKEKYPNITSKYPKGGYEYNVNLDSNIKSSHDEALEEAALMPKGFTSSAAKFAGVALGTILSPTSWAGGGLAVKGTKFAADALIGSAITKTLLGRTTLKFAFGSAEGLGYIAPLTAGEQLFYKQMDEKAPPVWTELLIGALTGGVLKTAFGSRTMFDPKTMEYALQTAKDQAASGKKINVEPLLKQSQHEASKTWPETGEEIQTKLDDMKSEINMTRRDEFQQRLIAAQDLSKEINKKNNLDGTITLFHGASKGNIDKITTEGKFNEGSYFSVRKGGTEFGDSPLDVAKRKFGKEGDVIKINVDARELESAAAGSEVFSPQALIRDDLGIWRSENVKDKSADLQKTIDETELYQQVHASKPQAPAVEEVQGAVNKATDWKSNRLTDMKIFNKAEDLIKQPETPADKKLAALDDTIKTFKDNNLLSDNAKAVLDEGEEEQKQHTGVTDALKTLTNCGWSK